MTPSPGEALIDHGAAKREAHYLATPGPDDYISADLLNLARAYLALAAERGDGGPLGPFANWVRHREGCCELMRRQMSENMPPTCSCGLDNKLSAFDRTVGR